jgi:hypothetical protein
MPTIKNALWSPLSVELEKRVIRIDPRKTEEISDADVQSPGVQKLLQSGNIYLLPEPAAPDKKTRGRG